MYIYGAFTKIHCAENDDYGNLCLIGYFDKKEYAENAIDECIRSTGIQEDISIRDADTICIPVDGHGRFVQEAIDNPELAAETYEYFIIGLPVNRSTAKNFN